MKHNVFEALRQARAAKQPVVLATEITSGRQLLLGEDSLRLAGDLSLNETLAAGAMQAMAQDRSAFDGNTGVFLQVFNPPLRLIVVGAVHIAQALVPMAQVLGYAVTVVDPRRAWASAERFPGVALTHDWPDEALAALKPDRRTAVVTLTHDPKLDDPALTLALGSAAFYVGALGSKRTHEKRRQRLAEAGVSEGAFSRIDGPIGLPLGGRSPAEIALSILAKMTQVRHGAPDLVPAA